MCRMFACLTFLLTIGWSGASAQEYVARRKPPLEPPAPQQIDPSIASRLPKGAKVHFLTEDEFRKALLKTPPPTAKLTESRIITNPNALASESSVFSELAVQKQGADADALKLKMRPPSKMPPSPGPSPVTPAPRPSPTLQTHPLGVSKYAEAPPPNTALNGCYALSHGQMTIGAVTGQTTKFVFTPISKYNLYSIHGCNFGDDQPGRKAWIYTAGFHADFQIEAWTDDLIVMKLGENISGVLDLDNLQLVIHRADGKEVQAGGFRFFAARDEGVLLRYIPPGWRKLDWNITGQHEWSQHPSLQSNSPVSGPYVPASASGVTSIYVTRGMNDKFTPATDSFDLSQLPKGWVVESVSWTTFPANCPYVVTYRQDFGQWDVQWSVRGGQAIQVSWGDTSCSGFEPNPFLGIPTNIYQNRTQSSYALKVFVRGPRGTESLLPRL